MVANSSNKKMLTNPVQFVSALLAGCVCCVLVGCDSSDTNSDTSSHEHSGLADAAVLTLPVPGQFRQIAALDSNNLILEISLNDNSPMIYYGQSGLGAWTVAFDAAASQAHNLSISWIETFQNQRLLLARQNTSFTTGTTATTVNLNSSYTTIGDGFDFDADNISNLAERQTASDPLVANTAPPQVTEPVMVAISAGCFSMGSAESESERLINEILHDVCVGGFQLGKFEVTFEQYDRFALLTGRALPDAEGWGRGKRPVTNVSWYDATAYAEWSSTLTGKSYRLPTEAEWEYAARSGTTTPFNTGGTISTGLANYNGNISYNGSPIGQIADRTAEVGSYAPNAWGLHDMHGNLFEWNCSNFSIEYIGGELLCELDQNNSGYAYRGGSWRSPPAHLRSAYRSRGAPAFLNYDIGFRIALD